MKDDNLGRDEKKHVAKKNMDVENRCRRYAAEKIHERIRVNARMICVQKGRMSREERGIIYKVFRAEIQQK